MIIIIFALIYYFHNGQQKEDAVGLLNRYCSCRDIIVTKHEATKKRRRKKIQDRPSPLFNFQHSDIHSLAINRLATERDWHFILLYLLAVNSTKAVIDYPQLAVRQISSCAAEA